MGPVKMMRAELKKLIGLFVVVIIILKMVYFKEQTINLAKLTAAYFYLYLIPGYVFLLPNRKIKSYHKVLIGFGIGLAMTNMLIYLGSFFLGLNLGLTAYLVPLLLAGVGVYRLKKTNFPAKTENTEKNLNDVE